MRTEPLRQTRPGRDADGAAARPLVGRDAELELLELRLRDAAEGRGGLLLVSGEAGVGKSALVDTALRNARLPPLGGGPTPHPTAPYAPIASMFRDHERAFPGTLAASGPLAAHLAIVLPELGAPPPAGGSSTLGDAIRDAFRAIASHRPAVALLEDLQWADEATLELLPQLAAGLTEVPFLLVACCRSEEIHRGHGFRRARAELRRLRLLEEHSLAPLTREATAALADALTGGRCPPGLSDAIFERTGGIPFFIEEIVASLLARGRMDEAEPARSPADLPLPQTIRDAVRLRTDRLTAEGREALEIAAVAGLAVDPRQLEPFGRGLDDAMGHGFLVESPEGMIAFRHALVREGVYADIPWTRRRAHHRAIAERLEREGAPPERIAEQWLGAREPERARPNLMRAAEAFCAVHAYRDAARVGRQALEVWPEGADEPGRLALLERYGHCAELAGDLAEAARAWEEVLDAHEAAGRSEALGEVARRLAGVYDIQGMPERTRGARERAAAAFEACGRIADAVLERMAIAERLELAGSGRAALTLLTGLAGDIARTGEVDLRIRALALEGEFRAKLGEFDAGVGLAREALELALERGSTGATAEAYYRLGAALENACDHGGAVEAYTAARGFCLGRKIDGLAQVCFACMLPAVLLTGQWNRTIEIAQAVLRSPHSPEVARMKATLHIALIAALRGNATRARRLLEETWAYSQRAMLVPIEVFSTWGLARVLELQGESDEAAARCRELVRRAGSRDERHYSAPPLRWAATLFSRRGETREVGACADLLLRISSATGHPEYLGPLAHALGELALVRGDAAAAAPQFDKALELMAEAGLPFERAETQLRAGVAHAAAGRREEAVERITAAYRTARKLGARPLALAATAELRALGEPLEPHLGRRGVDVAAAGGLSRREVEVLRLASDGMTNREIAARLFLSTRTVDMHMRNVLSRLGCRSRTEAAGRARALRILP